MGWDNQGGSTAVFGGVQVPPGDPGIDTNAPGALVLGEVNATSIDADVPFNLAPNTGIGTGPGISSDGSESLVGGASLAGGQFGALLNGDYTSSTLTCLRNLLALASI